MNKYPINVLFLKKRNENGKVNLAVPFEHFKSGIWQLAIDSLSYELDVKPPKNIQWLCGLKCNWITNIEFDNNLQLISQSPIIFQFKISNQKDCFYNNKTWFDINAISEFLNFEILDLGKESSFMIDCNVNILVLVQRKL